VPSFSPNSSRKDEVGEVAGGGRVKAVLHNEKLDRAKSVLEELVVGEGDCGIGDDKPESFDFPLDCDFDDIGIGKAAGGGDAVDGNVPDMGKFFPVLLVVELTIAGKRGGKTSLAGTHGVALAGDGKRRGTSAADVTRDQGEVLMAATGDGTLGRVIDAHGPAN
jgi:hypothetical protein